MCRAVVSKSNNRYISLMGDIGKQGRGVVVELKIVID